MDWKLATTIAGGGFGMVFFVLAILYVAIILTKEVIDKFILKSKQ